MTQKQKQDPVSNITMPGDVNQYEPIPVPDVSNLKGQRLVEIKQMIEARLQQSVSEAARIRSNITTAKTDCKRKFYDKKFKKINAGVREDVLSLQQIQYLITKNTGEADDTNPNPSSTED